MENGGAKHRIDQTRPGSGNSTDLERKTRMLKSAVTRTRNRVDKLESEYGARDVPQSSPYYPKIAGARKAHADARKAHGEHMRETGAW
jgi:hypothetical protein